MHDFLQFVLSLLERGIGLAVAAVAVGCVIFAAIYFIFRIKTKGTKKFPWGKAIAALMLVGYTAVLVYATLLRDSGGASVTNFHLFRAWREAWNSCSLQNWLNVLLNVALFIPLGILLPLLINRLRKWYALPVIGFGTSLFIELVQYATGRGMLDVDDLFANTLGGILGYCIVMAVLSLFGRKEKTLKKRLAYLAFPAAFAIVLVGLYAGYHLKEYGNLEESPVFTADTKGVVWNLTFELNDAVTSVPVYRTEPLNKATCDAFGAEFAANAKITFLDAYYYDHTTIFANHFTGDFLNVNYYDRSYEYTPGKDVLVPAGKKVDETFLREILKGYGIYIPKTAEYSDDGEGRYTFSVNMQPIDGGFMDGALYCRYDKEGSILKGITNRLVTLAYYKDVPVMTQSAAYKRLCKGKFANGDRFEYYAPSQVSVLSCTMEYRIDTKGFYRPVYVFDVVLDGEICDKIIMPAWK